MSATEATIQWWETRNHPWSTHNPWLDRTWCRCGARVADGKHPIDLDALWEISHTCDGSQLPCRCHLDRKET